VLTKTYLETNPSQEEVAMFGDRRRRIEEDVEKLLLLLKKEEESGSQQGARYLYLGSRVKGEFEAVASKIV